MQTTLLLDMVADTDPDRPAVTDANGTTTCGELRARARTGASWLAGQIGDKLIYLGLNGASFPLALFAAGMSGRPLVPLNYRLTDGDLRRLVERAAPAVAVVDEDMLRRIGGIEGITAISTTAFAKVCRDPAHHDREPPAADNDIAMLLFTSGTTGEPKAAVLRHANLTSYVISTVEFLGAEDGEAAIISVPPYHIAGISAVLTGLYGGRRLVYLPTFSADAWIDLADGQAVTHAMVVPTMLGRILDAMDARGIELPALRALSYGGGRMPRQVIERALDRLPHVDFVNAYGLTETSSTIAILQPVDHRVAITSSDPAVRRRLGSVGRPLPALELEIRDDHGQRCPPGTPGEIHVRGDQVSGEYLGRTMLTEDGWFPTKDLGWLDDEGYLFVEGRLDDVIVRGGENISPGEVEDVLRLHADVADVAVVGLPDVEWGERLAAVIVRRNGAVGVGQLTDWVRERLRSTKTPEVWRFQDALPYNDTGKLLRRVLRAELIAAETA